MSNLSIKLLSVQDQRSFLFVDVVSNALFVGLWFYLVYKEISPFVPPQKKEKFERWKPIFFQILLFQFALHFMDFICLMIGVIPCTLHNTSKHSTSFFSFLFMIQWVVRLVVLFSATSFFFTFFPTSDTKRRQALIFALFILLFFINVFGIIYYMSSVFNEPMVIYEGFFRIRNVFFQKGESKASKNKEIQGILKEIKSEWEGQIPESLEYMYRKQWECSLSNNFVK